MPISARPSVKIVYPDLSPFSVFGTLCATGPDAAGKNEEEEQPG
ncbi:hypothetical protein [Salmonirosea aquatica]